MKNITSMRNNQLPIKTLVELKDISNVNVRDWPFELSPPDDIYRVTRFTTPTRGEGENVDSYIQFKEYNFNKTSTYLR